MFVLARALVYATFFVAILLVYLPARLLAWTGLVRPEIGLLQILALVVAAAGALIAVWCVLAFAWIGKGTPAPFDPPRRLIVRGPYRFVRNPMYVGLALAFAGAVLFYRSVPLLIYACVFLLALHLMAVFYEEPTLRRTFGQEYEAYCRRVHRWRPGVPRGPASS